uniref:Brix domain-containing protein n=1 Tax=Ditylum brightwellii TaxID=49249 RepID=A0A7S1Z5U4_9STRA|mmetsp:Transcript_25037/g.37375  ORF Transcript_25037/g.37375 Transcript_25037/m.37375 type:complete len:349 (+) Transcript_25037:135-1181(+)
MGKKRADPSLKGKKPTNTSKAVKSRPVTKNPGGIRNKLKRSEMYGRYLLEKKAKKRELRLQRSKEAEELGEDAQHVKQTPRTLDNTREVEQTLVRPDDEEVMADEMEDEFAPYFSDEIRPKILLTTRPMPSGELFHFIGDLMRFFPQLFYYPRKSYSIKDICRYAINRDFTHLMVLSEKSKVCNGMIISHLRPSPDHVGGNARGGPTAFFKVSNVIKSTDVPNHGNASSHVPELVLNGFGTRLGHRAGRFLGSLFPHNAQFKGRQVATFHNQRDFIFVRHHRYVFEEGKETNKETKKPKTKARLQELGPRFTLKMKWLQEGTFDTQFGEYEWFHKRKEMDTTRRKFHL